MCYFTIKFTKWPVGVEHVYKIKYNIQCWGHCVSNGQIHWKNNTNLYNIILELNVVKSWVSKYTSFSKQKSFYMFVDWCWNIAFKWKYIPWKRVGYYIMKCIFKCINIFTIYCIFYLLDRLFPKWKTILLCLDEKIYTRKCFLINQHKPLLCYSKVKV